MILATVRSRPIRQATVLVASFALYLTWGVWFAAVLLASIVMNYLVGKWIRREHSGLTLSIGILLNLALLSTFKYLPEAAVHLPFSSLQRFAHLALPLGISFWTFQAMSYLFDVYQGDDVRAIVLRICFLHGFLPRHDRRAHLPHVRDASAISFRERHAFGRHRARVPAHRHRRAHDATGQIAGTGSSWGR